MHAPRIKYPRTPHLPWSPGASVDDLVHAISTHFDGLEVVVTEKMDGENTTLYADGLHARSLDGRHHPSRAWIKQLHGQLAHLIPDGWRLCGENLHARHSIAYDDLESWFCVFSIWDEHNLALSWDETVEWAHLLGLVTVPVLDRGPWDEARLRDLPLDTRRAEGWVVRTADGFPFDAFADHVAKWVRPHHVQTDDNWMFQPVVTNGLRTP